MTGDADLQRLEDIYAQIEAASDGSDEASETEPYSSLESVAPTSTESSGIYTLSDQISNPLVSPLRVSTASRMNPIRGNISESSFELINGENDTGDDATAENTSSIYSSDDRELLDQSLSASTATNSTSSHAEASSEGSRHTSPRDGSTQTSKKPSEVEVSEREPLADSEYSSDYNDSGPEFYHQEEEESLHKDVSPDASSVTAQTLAGKSVVGNKEADRDSGASLESREISNSNVTTETAHSNDITSKAESGIGNIAATPSVEKCAHVDSPQDHLESDTSKDRSSVTAPSAGLERAELSEEPSTDGPVHTLRSQLGTGHSDDSKEVVTTTLDAPDIDTKSERKEILEGNISTEDGSTEAYADEKSDDGDEEAGPENLDAKDNLESKTVLSKQDKDAEEVDCTDATDDIAHETSTATSNLGVESKLRSESEFDQFRADAASPGSVEHHANIAGTDPISAVTNIEHNPILEPEPAQLDDSLSKSEPDQLRANAASFEAVEQHANVPETEQISASATSERDPISGPQSSQVDDSVLKLDEEATTGHKLAEALTGSDSAAESESRTNNLEGDAIVLDVHSKEAEPPAKSSAMESILATNIPRCADKLGEEYNAHTKKSRSPNLTQDETIAQVDEGVEQSDGEHKSKDVDTSNVEPSSTTELHEKSIVEPVDIKRQIVDESGDEERDQTTSESDAFDDKENTTRSVVSGERNEDVDQKLLTEVVSAKDDGDAENSTITGHGDGEMISQDDITCTDGFEDKAENAAQDVVDANESEGSLAKEVEKTKDFSNWTSDSAAGSGEPREKEDTPDATSRQSEDASVNGVPESRQAHSHLTTTDAVTAINDTRSGPFESLNPRMPETVAEKSIHIHSAHDETFNTPNSAEIDRPSSPSTLTPSVGGGRILNELSSNSQSKVTSSGIDQDNQQEDSDYGDGVGEDPIDENTIETENRTGHAHDDLDDNTGKGKSEVQRSPRVEAIDTNKGENLLDIPSRSPSNQSIVEENTQDIHSDVKTEDMKTDVKTASELSDRDEISYDDSELSPNEPSIASVKVSAHQESEQSNADVASDLKSVDQSTCSDEENTEKSLPDYSIDPKIVTTHVSSHPQEPEPDPEYSDKLSSDEDESLGSSQKAEDQIDSDLVERIESGTVSLSSQDIHAVSKDASEKDLKRQSVDIPADSEKKTGELDGTDPLPEDIEASDPNGMGLKKLLRRESKPTTPSPDESPSSSTTPEKAAKEIVSVPEAPTSDDSQTVYLYMSLASGVRGAMSHFNKATTILQSYDIKFVPVEITMDEDALRRWKYKGAKKGKQLPAVFRDGDLKLDYPQLLESNELEAVEDDIFDDI